MTDSGHPVVRGIHHREEKKTPRHLRQSLRSSTTTSGARGLMDALADIKALLCQDDTQTLLSIE